MRKDSFVLLLLCILAGVLLILRPTQVPPLWFDEGWYLSVARNWVEEGHYGQLLSGEPTPASMLNAGFPAIAPIALSFRLFGVGVWQGRLAGVFFVLGALVLIYYLAGRLYNRRVAIGTLAVLLLMPAWAETHPVLYRQALGEMPALFYLLAGFACFLSAWHRPLWFIPLAVGFWSLALMTKPQVPPFFSVSLLVPLSITLFRRCWKFAGLLAAGLFGSLVGCQLLGKLQELLLRGQMLPETPTPGEYYVSAFVPVAAVRIAALLVTLTVGLPALFGLCYAVWKSVGHCEEAFLNTGPEVVRLALVALAGSWFAWYVSLSAGWFRYLFPATFLSSIFVAALLHDLTDGFSLSSTVKRGGYALRHWCFNLQGAGALLAIVLISSMVPTTLRALYRSYVVEADASVLQVADFLNTQTVTDAVIETYDSELFFLLDRRYHYPPDWIQVQLNRRTFLGQDVSIDYDPLEADPDYLVVGPHSKLWRLYDPILETGEFRLLQRYRRYDLYERVR